MRYSYRLRSKSSLRIVVICNYKNSPITAEQCRAKENLLHPRRSYFAPINRSLSGVDSLLFRRLRLVEAPGTAPGSEWFIMMSIYRHSRKRSGNYNICNAKGKLKPYIEL